MTEPERTGGKPRLVQVSENEADIMLSDGLSGPRLYSDYIGESSPRYYCEPAELERWRAARAESQAGESN